MATQTKRKLKRESTIVGYVFIAMLLGAVPAALNIYVDPYELLQEKNRSDRLREVAEKAHYPLWKLGRYKPEKHDTIILGDSRARALREKYWRAFNFETARNLAYGGGTIPEIYETFKVIKNDRALKNLVIGIQLRSFDEDHKQGLNRVPEAVSLIGKPIDYVFNWSIAKTSLKLFREEHPGISKTLDNVHAVLGVAHAAQISGQEASSPDPILSSRDVARKLVAPVRELPKKFAKQVSQNARSDWKNFEFSERYWSYLQEISDWSKEHSVTLIFVIPPTIFEMQQTIEAFGLKGLDLSLRQRLTKLGLVVDLDFPNTLVTDLKNFTDAYHFNSKIALQIVGEVANNLTEDGDTRKLVEKRRKKIHCKTGFLSREKSSTLKSPKFHTGRNCRIWMRETG